MLVERGNLQRLFAWKSKRMGAVRLSRFVRVISNEEIYGIIIPL
jgi:hypothetical protein